jgi:hypothetical protein
MGLLAISPALGGPAFLTAKKAKRTFVTKRAAKKTFVTKKAATATFARKTGVYSKPEADARFLTGAQGDARYLTGAQGDGRYLPATAATTLQVPTMTFVSKFGNAAASSVQYNGAETALHGDSATPQTFFAGVTMPGNLQGRDVTVQSFDLCYDAGTLAVIDEVFLARSLANPSESTSTNLIDDTTDRADSTCRTYSASPPITLDPTQGILVGVKAKFPTGANEVVIQRLTLHLGT